MLVRHFSKIIAILLSGLLFTTQSVFANAIENNFWKQRKATQIARLPQVQSPIPTPTFPPVLNATKIRSTVKINPEDRKRIQSTKNKTLETLIKNIPAHTGSIRRVTLPKSKKTNKIVVHIQDVHQNMDAQKNIGETIYELLNKGQVELVGLEGAFSKIDLSSFRTYPKPEAVRTVADYLLNNHEISGPIHAAFSHLETDFPFVGIDHKDHYKANVAAYKKSRSLFDAQKSSIEAEKRVLAAEKTKTFNETLKKFDDLVVGYRTGSISLGNYLSRLTSYQSISDLSDAALFKEVLKLEETLNFSAVEIERSILVRKLLEKLNKQESTQLLDTAVAYRLGQIGHAAFYQHLKALCKSKNINLHQYANINAYIQYVLLADGIKFESVLAQMKDLENQTYSQLIQSEEERILVKKSKKHFLASRLVEFSLTPDEWNEYKKSLPRSAVRDFGLAERGLISFENFYREAEARDNAMAENLLREMDKNNADVAVLVTGGFHAPGMTDLLSNAGVTTITYVPNISKVDTAKGSGYLSVFAREKTPMEQIFKGEKLYLANAPNAAGKPYAATLVPGADMTATGDVTNLVHAMIGEPEAGGIKSVSVQSTSDGREVKVGHRDGNTVHLVLSTIINATGVVLSKVRQKLQQPSILNLKTALTSLMLLFVPLATVVLGSDGSSGPFLLGVTGLQVGIGIGVIVLAFLIFFVWSTNNKKKKVLIALNNHHRKGYSTTLTLDQTIDGVRSTKWMMGGDTYKDVVTKLKAIAKKSDAGTKYKIEKLIGQPLGRSGRKGTASVEVLLILPLLAASTVVGLIGLFVVLILIALVIVFSLKEGGRRKRAIEDLINYNSTKNRPKRSLDSIWRDVRRTYWLIPNEIEKRSVVEHLIEIVKRAGENEQETSPIKEIKKFAYSEKYKIGQAARDKAHKRNGFSYLEVLISIALVSGGIGLGLTVFRGNLFVPAIVGTLAVVALGIAALRKNKSDVKVKASIFHSGAVSLLFEQLVFLSWGPIIVLLAAWLLPMYAGAVTQSTVLLSLLNSPVLPLFLGSLIAFVHVLRRPIDIIYAAVHPKSSFRYSKRRNPQIKSRKDFNDGVIMVARIYNRWTFFAFSIPYILTFLFVSNPSSWWMGYGVAYLVSFIVGMSVHAQTWSTFDASPFPRIPVKASMGAGDGNRRNTDRWKMKDSPPESRPRKRSRAPGLVFSIGLVAILVAVMLLVTAILRNNANVNQDGPNKGDQAVAGAQDQTPTDKDKAGDDKSGRGPPDEGKAQPQDQTTQPTEKSDIPSGRLVRHESGNWVLSARKADGETVYLSGASAMAFEPVEDTAHISDYNLSGNYHLLYKAGIPVDVADIDAEKYPKLVELHGMRGGAAPENGFKNIASMNVRIIETYNIAGAITGNEAKDQRTLEYLDELFTYAWKEHGLFFTIGLYDPRDDQARKIMKFFGHKDYVLTYRLLNEFNTTNSKINSRTYKDAQDLITLMKNVSPDDNDTIMLVLGQPLEREDREGLKATDFDILGVTFYGPTGERISDILKALQDRYGKPVVVAEHGNQTTDPERNRFFFERLPFLIYTDGNIGHILFSTAFKYKNSKWKAAADDSDWKLFGTAAGDLITNTGAKWREISVDGFKVWVPKEPDEQAAQPDQLSTPTQKFTTVLHANYRGEGWFGTYFPNPDNPSDVIDQEVTDLILGHKYFNVTVGNENVMSRLKGFHIDLKDRSDTQFFSLFVVNEGGTWKAFQIKNGRRVYVEGLKFSEESGIDIPMEMIKKDLEGSFGAFHVQSGKFQDQGGVRVTMNPDGTVFTNGAIRITAHSDDPKAEDKSDNDQANITPAQIRNLEERKDLEAMTGGSAVLLAEQMYFSVGPLMMVGFMGLIYQFGFITSLSSLYLTSMVLGLAAYVVAKPLLKKRFRGIHSQGRFRLNQKYRPDLKTRQQYDDGLDYLFDVFDRWVVMPFVVLSVAGLVITSTPGFFFLSQFAALGTALGLGRFRHELSWSHFINGRYDLAPVMASSGGPSDDLILGLIKAWNESNPDLTIVSIRQILTGRHDEEVVVVQITDKGFVIDLGASIADALDGPTVDQSRETLQNAGVATQMVRDVLEPALNQHKVSQQVRRQKQAAARTPTAAPAQTQTRIPRQSSKTTPNLTGRFVLFTAVAVLITITIVVGLIINAGRPTNEVSRSDPGTNQQKSAATQGPDKETPEGPGQIDSNKSDENKTDDARGPPVVDDNKTQVTPPVVEPKEPEINIIPPAADARSGRLVKHKSGTWVIEVVQADGNAVYYSGAPGVSLNILNQDNTIKGPLLDIFKNIASLNVKVAEINDLANALVGDDAKDLETLKAIDTILKQAYVEGLVFTLDLGDLSHASTILSFFNDKPYVLAYTYTPTRPNEEAAQAVSKLVENGQTGKPIVLSFSGTLQPRILEGLPGLVIPGQSFNREGPTVAEARLTATVGVTNGGPIVVSGYKVTKSNIRTYNAGGDKTIPLWTSAPYEPLVQESLTGTLSEASALWESTERKGFEAVEAKDTPLPQAPDPQANDGQPKTQEKTSDPVVQSDNTIPPVEPDEKSDKAVFKPLADYIPGVNGIMQGQESNENKHRTFMDISEQASTEIMNRSHLKFNFDARLAGKIHRFGIQIKGEAGKVLDHVYFELVFDQNRTSRWVSYRLDPKTNEKVYLSIDLDQEFDLEKYRHGITRVSVPPYLRATSGMFVYQTGLLIDPKNPDKPVRITEISIDSGLVDKDGQPLNDQTGGLPLKGLVQIGATSLKDDVSFEGAELLRQRKEREVQQEKENRRKQRNQGNGKAAKSLPSVMFPLAFLSGLPQSGGAVETAGAVSGIQVLWPLVGIAVGLMVLYAAVLMLSLYKARASKRADTKQVVESIARGFEAMLYAKANQLSEQNRHDVGDAILAALNSGPTNLGALKATQIESGTLALPDSSLEFDSVLAKKMLAQRLKYLTGKVDSSTLMHTIYDHYDAGVGSQDATKTLTETPDKTLNIVTLAEPTKSASNEVQAAERAVNLELAESVFQAGVQNPKLAAVIVAPKGMESALREIQNKADYTAVSGVRLVLESDLYNGAKTLVLRDLFSLLKNDNLLKTATSLRLFRTPGLTYDKSGLEFADAMMRKALVRVVDRHMQAHPLTTEMGVVGEVLLEALISIGA